MVECLLLSLKGSRYPSLLSDTVAHLCRCSDPTNLGDTDSLFSHPIELADRLKCLITDALRTYDNPEADILACTAFAALLQTSLLSNTLWEHFKHGVMSSALLQRLLLDEHNAHKRSQMAMWIKRVYETSIV